MKVVQVPWFAVEKGSTVVVDGRPRVVTDPWKLGVVIFDGLDWHVAHEFDMATVLIPETNDAIRVLSGQFTVEILEET